MREAERKDLTNLLKRPLDRKKGVATVLTRSDDARAPYTIASLPGSYMVRYAAACAIKALRVFDTLSPDAKATLLNNFGHAEHSVQVPKYGNNRDRIVWQDAAGARRPLKLASDCWALEPCSATEAGIRLNARAEKFRIAMMRRPANIADEGTF